MSDKLFDNSHTYGKRFQCHCLHFSHVMDVSVEKWEDGDWLNIEFAEYYVRPPSVWDRIKLALKLLCRRQVLFHDFWLRQEDIPELIEMLERACEKSATAAVKK